VFRSNYFKNANLLKCYSKPVYITFNFQAVWRNLLKHHRQNTPYQHQTQDCAANRLCKIRLFNPDAANHKCPVGGGVPGRAVGASESESRASCFGTNEYMRVLVLWAG